MQFEIKIIKFWCVFTLYFGPNFFVISYCVLYYYLREDGQMSRWNMSEVSKHTHMTVTNLSAFVVTDITYW
jgi:hypothetical protein